MITHAMTSLIQENIGLGKLGREQREEVKAHSTSTPSASDLVSEATSKAKTHSSAATDDGGASPKAKPSSTVAALAALPSSFTSYLLAILDSPAYANLTSAFLRAHFNPATPDAPHVRYFSVAGRTESVNVWHPFWFTKMVLDAWERKERARLEAEGYPREAWADDRAWGNDGLVTVQSARWGEFLGVVEGADHWEIRGARGIEFDVDFKLGALTKGIEMNLGLGGLGLGLGSAAEWDWGKFVRAWRKEERTESAGREKEKATTTTTTVEVVESDGGERANATSRPNSKAASEPEPKVGIIAAREKTAEEKEKDAALRASTDRLSAVFDWIVDHVPTESIGKLSSTVKAVELSSAAKEGAAAAAARTKEGTDRKGERNELATKEDLERFYVALARKLYDEGL
jgi:triacylglycerol lipase